MKIAKTPQEIELWHIIPAIKREMAKILIKKGYKQNEIASLLETTKSAISQYLSAKRAKEFSFEDDIIKQINQSVNNVISKANVRIEIQKIVGLVRKKGKICELLKCGSENCKVCMNDIS